MKNFQITFSDVLVKRVAAPNEQAIDIFISQFENKPTITLLQDYSGELDAIINESGKPEYEDMFRPWFSHKEWWEKQAACIARKTMNIYEGRRGKTVQVLLNNKKFSPKTSQKVYNHSPDGFEWGYEGSGPAQLALAVLLEETGDPILSMRLYQQFKRDVIATAPEKGWAFASPFVQNWLKENQ